MAHHEHHQSPEKSLGEQNKEHFDKFAVDAFSIPWIVDLSNSITKELQKNAEWIGIDQSSPDEDAHGKRMLDYACGNGLATRALAPFFETILGMDISSGMVEQYNKKAQEAGTASENRRAIQADLLNTDATPSPELDSPEFFGFDAIVMCMALHHVENYATMVQKLSERLKKGGILVIVDWVAPSESGCPITEKVHELSHHTITRMGFKESEVRVAYQDAGLEGWSWKWASERNKMPEEIGGEQQLFIARGQMPFSS
ncbi:S-adenosyl-L-methionine-dependent methyltransferase [Mariannaea sp. PMI_226]|nr:S-adenosyl-L-methionine-dependent methyltransferase [Mariannaea sp. PMI_226]